MSEKDNTYIVYMHKLFDGRAYVGITSRDLKTRGYKGSGYYRSPKFYAAIKKYGWDSFQHIVLYKGLSKTDAEAKERELISLHKCTERKHGFNIQLGGSYAGKMTEESKQKIRNARLGKKSSEETRLKMSIARKGVPQSESHKANRSAALIGHKHSEETKKKIGEKNSIANRGRKQSDEEILKRRLGSKSKKPVVQLSKLGEPMREWDSLSEAARNTKVSVQSISNAIAGRIKFAGGFGWRFSGVSL